MSDTAIDPDALKRYSFSVWNYKMGEMVSLMIHLGDRLGLYKALQGAGAITAAELAEKTGLKERWLLEWLRGQAAARLLLSADGDHFELSPEGAEVLANEEGSLAFAAGAFSGQTPPETVDKLVDAFHTGIGLSYQDLGPNAAHRTERMLGPWTRKELVPNIIPALDGVAAKLEAGAVAADVGCGGGVALIAMAEAFPNSEFHGYDPSQHAIDRCHEKVEVLGLDNVRLFVHLRLHSRHDPAGRRDLLDSWRAAAGGNLADQGHSQPAGVQGQPQEPAARHVLRFLGFRLHVFRAVRTGWCRAGHAGLQSGGGRADDPGCRVQPLPDA